MPLTQITQYEVKFYNQLFVIANKGELIFAILKELIFIIDFFYFDDEKFFRGLNNLYCAIWN